MSLIRRDVMPEHGGWVWPLSLFCIIAPTVVVAIRIWSRLINRRSQPFGLDDWAAVSAWPFACAMYVLFMLAMRSGIGVRDDQLSDEEYARASTLLLASFVVYYMVGDLIRVSLTLYYGRLFSSSRTFKRFVWANVALNVAWQVSGSFAVAWQCDDPRSLWDRSVVSTCRKPIEHQYYCGLSSICLDLIVLLLPVPMVCRLQLKPSKKRELLAVFFVSYLVPIFTITRFAITMEHEGELNSDPLYGYVYVLEWASLEILAGYLGICMPAILYLCRRWYNKGFAALFNSRAASKKDLSKHSTTLSEDGSAPGRDSESFNVSEVTAGDEHYFFSSTLEDLVHPMAILHTRTYAVTSEGKSISDRSTSSMS